MPYKMMYVLAVGMGLLVTLQGSLNSRLGILLKNPIMATFIALLVAASCAFVILLIRSEQMPDAGQLKSVPTYLWFVGGILSFMATSLFYFVIPKAGLATTVTFGLAGQICFSALASHYAWFGLPADPITFKKIAGIGMLMLGVYLTKY